MRLRAALVAGVIAACVANDAGAVEALSCQAAIRPVAPPFNACLGTETVRIAAVGDVLLHRPLQYRGYTQPDGFRGIWRVAEPLFRAAHVAYANLEGPVAPGLTRTFAASTDPGPVFDNRVYTSYPLFNYHPRVLGDLQAAGITLVSTANNHAMDRGPQGADATIDRLEALGLRYTGTIRAGAPRRFAAYTDTPLGRIAWIACSLSTNGVPDPQGQVLLCDEHRAELLDIVATHARHPGIAAVIVTPHWGYEYQHSPNATQRALARDLIRLGATAVIGTHSHVTQPWEFHETGAGDRGLAIYSTGNFVSGQVSLSRRTGVLAVLELCRRPPAPDLATSLGTRLAIAHAGYATLFMARSTLGPVLQIPGPETTGLPAEARKLNERLIPTTNLSVELACREPTPADPVIALQ